MIILDTHALLDDALNPKRLSIRARAAIAEGDTAGTLGCSDISLWEIAMLIARRRVRVDADAREFLEALLEARATRVLPVTPAIAVLAQSDQFSHGDPAERIIAATALVHRARLVSADRSLRGVKGLSVVW